MKKNSNKNGVFLILHDIRSEHNVGSIFRTADAAGVSKIFLTGYTPAPRDKFGREVKEISKTALGAEKNVEWQKIKDCKNLLRKLKKEKVFIVAVEQDENSVDYKKIKPKFPVAFIFGNEVSGLPKNILAECDAVAEIPMKGEKESLNVAVSAGVVLFRVLDI